MLFLKLRYLECYAIQCNFVNFSSSNLNSAGSVPKLLHLEATFRSISVEIISNYGKYRVYVQSAIKG